MSETQLRPAGLYPEVGFDGGKLMRVFDGGMAEYEVPKVDVVECVLCSMPITGQWDLTHGAGIVVGPNVFGVAHHDCMVKVLGHPTMVEGWRVPRSHADCAVCDQPWATHLSYGYETLVCPTWDGNAARVPLYEHAPGHVGPLREPWLVIAGEEPCACYAISQQEAA